MINIPQGYKPSDEEPYMCETQLEYFRQKLVSWKNQLLEESKQTIENLVQNSSPEPDQTDQAINEHTLYSEIKTKTRCRKLIKKIEEALERVETQEYGYCEETGEPIGIKRLEARPVAFLTIEAQERHERKERQYSDDD